MRASRSNRDSDLSTARSLFPHLQLESICLTRGNTKTSCARQSSFTPLGAPLSSLRLVHRAEYVLYGSNTARLAITLYFSW